MGMENPCGESVDPAEELGSETMQHVVVRLLRGQKQAVEGTKKRRKKEKEKKRTIQNWHWACELFFTPCPAGDTLTLCLCVCGLVTAI